MHLDDKHFNAFLLPNDASALIRQLYFSGDYAFRRYDEVLLWRTLHITIYVLYYFMIKTFKCKETQKIYNRTFSKKLPQDIQRNAYKKLLMVEASIDLNDLKIPPVNRLEKLTGNREGQHSIRINKQYRICFVWENGFAFDVEIVDYH